MIHRINRARFRSLAAFLDEGIHVVSDELFWRAEDLDPFLEHLHGHRVYLFGLDVSLAEGAQR